jgi:tyrosinase
MRTREDVWKLTKAEGNWPKVLEAYRLAVHKMRTLDPPTTDPPTAPTKPLSWQFQAALHGRPAPNPKTIPLGLKWNFCQHEGWFFFPWHRMYLLAFEAVVQDFLKDPTWSLPYWYSIDPDDTTTDVLPPAFRQPKVGKDDNDLYTVDRSSLANDGKGLRSSVIFASGTLDKALRDALNASTFSADVRFFDATFGGGVTKTAQFAQEMGLLEDTPHGAVHVLVGNDYDIENGDVVETRAGWMGDPLTAALDPIFWLHHSNIDRLWQVWLDADRDHRNPPDSDWLKTKFKFPAPGDTTVEWKVGDILDTATLGYRYDTTRAPSGVSTRVDVGLEAASSAKPPTPRRPTELVGATVDVPIGAGQRATIPLSQPALQSRGLAAADAAPQRVLLRLEGITGTRPAPLYNVYLNVPAGASPANYPDRLAGTISTFGVREASRPDGEHGGQGVNKVLDITDVRNALVQAGDWDPSNLSVAFVPLAPLSAAAQAAVTETTTAPQAASSGLHAARIAVFVVST